MLQSAHKIKLCTKDFNFNMFFDDYKKIDAVVRNFEIIGCVLFNLKNYFFGGLIPRSLSLIFLAFKTNLASSSFEIFVSPLVTR